MVTLTLNLRTLLVVEAERARIAVDAECASISHWERDDDRMRTLVNVGELLPGDERFPAGELYPLDSFPAVAALLREGRPYLDPGDVSSTALATRQRHGSHAGVPVDVAGERWGELWAARHVGAAPLTVADLDALRRLAARLGDGLEPYA